MCGLCVHVCSACACTRRMLHTHTHTHIIITVCSCSTIQAAYSGMMRYLCHLQRWPHSLQHGCALFLNRKVTRHPYPFLSCYTLSFLSLMFCQFIMVVRFFLLGDGANPCKHVPLMVYSQFYVLLFQAMCPCAVPSREALTLSLRRCGTFM